MIEKLEFIVQRNMPTIPRDQREFVKFARELEIWMAEFRRDVVKLVKQVQEHTHTHPGDGETIT